MSGWIIENTLVAGVLAMVVATACRGLRKHPALCHLLWLLVMIRLALPPIPVQTPLSKLLEPTRNVAPSVTLIRDVANVPEAMEAIEKSPDEAPMITSAMVEPTTMQSEAKWRMNGNVPLVLLWLGGSLVLLWRQIGSVFRFGKLLRLAQSPSRVFLNRLHHTAQSMSMRPPMALFSHHVGSPMVWTWGKPRLIWPSWQAVDSVESRMILAHELSHLKRKDHWICWLEWVLMGVFWWHPLFWLARLKMREYAELACDAWALHINPNGKRELAHAVLSALERELNQQRPLIAIPAYGLGKIRMKRRLSMIMKTNSEHRNPRWATWAAICLFAMLLSGWKNRELDTPPEIQDLDARIELAARGGVLEKVGNRLTKAEKWPEALEAYETALQVHPNRESILWCISEAALKAGEPGRAEEALKEILKKDDEHRGVYVALAQAAAAQSKWDQAEHYLRQAVEHGAIQAHVFADNVFEPMTERPEFNRLTQTALKIERLHHQKLDLDALSEMLELAPKSAELWGKLGYQAIGKGDLERAEAAFSKQIELNPHSSTAAYNLACTHSLAGHHERAIKFLERAFELGWDDSEHMRKDTDLDGIRSMARFESLVNLLERENQLGKDINRAMSQKQYQQAAQLIEEAWSLETLDDHDRAWIHSKSAMVAYHLKDYSAAAEQFIASMTEANEVDASTLYNIACVKSLNGEMEQAFAYLTVAIEAGFDDASHISEDSDLDALHGDPRFDECVKRAGEIELLELLGAVDLVSFRQDFKQNLKTWDEGRLSKVAWALYKTQNWPLGAEAFGALYEQTDSGTAAYNACCCWAMAGETEMALQWLKTAMDNGFDDFNHMQRDDDLDAIRDTEAFRKLVAR